MSLQLKALSYQVAGKVIIAELDWTIPRGARYCLMAGNGAGKTTLLNLISGVLRPQRGDVLWCDQKITRQSIEARHRLGIARSFQSSHLFPQLTVRQSFQLQHSRSSAPTESVNHQLAAMIETIFAPYWNQLNSALPYGVQRLLEVSLAINSAPQLLILDEPFAGLSIETKQEMTQLLQQLADTCSMIIVEHDVVSAYPLTIFAAILSDGKITLNQSWSSLLNTPHSLSDARRYYRGIEKLLSLDS